MFVVRVQFSIVAGKAHVFLKRVRQQARDSLEKESDCHVFDVCVDRSDDHKFMLYEVYTDPEAFKRHLESEHFLAFDLDVSPCIAEKSVEQYDRIN